MIKKSLIVDIIFTTLIIGFIFFITGCNRDNRLELRVLYYLDEAMPFSVSDSDDWTAEFEKENPNVKVVRENLFGELYHEKLKTYAVAGDLPDVFYAWPAMSMDYAHTSGTIFKDLMPFMQRDGLTSQYAAFTFDGSLQPAGRVDVFTQGIIVTHIFFINMEVLDAVGLKPARTYAELVSQVPILRAAGYQTVLMPAESDWVHSKCIFSMIIGRFCGADWYDRIASGQAKYTDPDFEAAFNFYRQIYLNGVILRANLEINNDEGPALFAGNRSAYYIDGSWRIDRFITDTNTGQALISLSIQDNIILRDFPEIPGAKMNNSNSAILSPGWAIADSLKAGSAKEDAAWRWVKFMLSKEVQQLRVERGGLSVPSNTNLEWDTMNLEPLQKAAGALGNSYQVVSPVIDSVVSSGVNDAFTTVLVQLALGEKTGAQAGADIQMVHEALR